MRANFSLIFFITVSVALFASQNALAGKVYQWMDEDGVVHFSDVAPENTATTDIREININIVHDTNADPDEYSIINQLDRMAERRRQSTEERLALKRLQIEEMRVTQEARQPVEISSYQYDPYIYSYGYSYPQPYDYYHRHRFYNQPGYFSYSSMKAHSGRFSVERRQTRRHQSRFGVRF